jgi:hypothetical protein
MTTSFMIKKPNFKKDEDDAKSSSARITPKRG